MVDHRQRQQVDEELVRAETSGRGDSPFADILTAADHGGDLRAEKGDGQRGDGVDAGRTHGLVHHHAEQQAGAERRQGYENMIAKRQETAKLIFILGDRPIRYLTAGEIAELRS